MKTFSILKYNIFFRHHKDPVLTTAFSPNHMMLVSGLPYLVHRTFIIEVLFFHRLPDAKEGKLFGTSQCYNIGAKVRLSYTHFHSRFNSLLTPVSFHNLYFAKDVNIPLCLDSVFMSAISLPDR